MLRKIAGTSGISSQFIIITVLVVVTNRSPWFNWAEDFTISFLNKVRLVADEVQLTHYEMYTIMEIAVRTIDQ